MFSLLHVFSAEACYAEWPAMQKRMFLPYSRGAYLSISPTRVGVIYGVRQLVEQLKMQAGFNLLVAARCLIAAIQQLQSCVVAWHVEYTFIAWCIPSTCLRREFGGACPVQASRSAVHALISIRNNIRIERELHVHVSNVFAHAGFSCYLSRRYAIKCILVAVRHVCHRMLLAPPSY